MVGSTQEMILNQIKFGGNTGWELRQLMEGGSLGSADLYLSGIKVVNPFGS